MALELPFIPVRNASFIKLPSPGVEQDGWSIHEACFNRGIIRSRGDLRMLVDAAPPRSIVAFRRSQLDPYFLTNATQEGESLLSRDSPMFSFDNWTAVSGSASGNAMPHVHGVGNFHLVAQPSQVPTAFFSSTNFAVAVQNIVEGTASDASPFPAALTDTPFFHRLAEIVDEFKVHQQFPQLLHQVTELWSRYPQDKSSFHTLACAIQEEIEHLGGMDVILLGENDFGAMYIPQFCLHGRKLKDSPARAQNTAWQYYTPK